MRVYDAAWTAEGQGCGDASMLLDLPGAIA